MTLNEDELISAIDQTGCRLLIIDPFQAFLPAGTNLGSVTKMRSIFTALANVAKATNVAIVLVGHLNKNENSKDIHRGFGSADIAASVRSIRPPSVQDSELALFRNTRTERRSGD